MGRHKAILFGITMLMAGMTGARQAEAQTFRTYRCADGTQFIVGFYDDDKRAFLQIDGEPVTLPSGWRSPESAIQERGSRL